MIINRNYCDKIRIMIEIFRAVDALELPSLLQLLYFMKEFVHNSDIIFLCM